jgi:uncharacterized protein (UPF0261 family)
MQKTIALIGTLDTKGNEYKYVQRCIEERGCKTLLIDVGILGEPAIPVEVSAAEVAQAGGGDLKTMRHNQDRGQAITIMSKGAEIILPRLYAEGRFDGVMALGGSGGTSVACAGMRMLPLGVPKLMLSTIASSDVSSYIGVKDIIMAPSIVDVAGLNQISRGVFARGAGAICGMLETTAPAGEDKPLIVASMFGNTTPAVETAKAILEQEGYEVLVFHATGVGGTAMESLIDAGLIAGVLDITTTEWADELVGGVFSAGPNRLGAAARSGVPAIVTPACLDMVNFYAPDTVPEKFAGRTFYQHNPNVTLMRTNAAECQQLGEIMAEKLNQSKASTTVLVPLKGWSMIDVPGQPFWAPEATAAFLEALKASLREDIQLIEMDCNVNDPEFAQRCAVELLANMRTP